MSTKSLWIQIRIHSSITGGSFIRSHCSIRTESIQYQIGVVSSKVVPVLEEYPNSDRFKYHWCQFHPKSLQYSKSIQIQMDSSITGDGGSFIQSRCRIQSVSKFRWIQISQPPRRQLQLAVIFGRNDQYAPNREWSGLVCSE